VLTPTPAGPAPRAETVLTPGQSGFVSAAGAPSPHLTDQVALFVELRRKLAAFGQPGETSRPRPGVRVVRGPFGVPAVHGAREADAWWGVGWVHAQDRLTQLDTLRRSATGRLAEVLGERALAADVANRRDFYTPAELDAMVAALPSAARTRIEAYRDGINAWIAHVSGSPRDLPAELAARGVPIEPLSTRDLAAMAVQIIRTIPSQDGLELANLLALRASGPRALEALLPLRTPGTVATIPAEEGRFPSQPGRTRRDERVGFRRSLALAATLPLPAACAAAASPAPTLRGGSLTFGAAPRGGGETVLFSGPQVGFTVPPLLVEFEVHAPGLRARGITIPGLPVVGIGRNARVAWGLTSGYSDDDDLYAERLVRGEAERYVFRGRPRAMDCRDERIAVRDAPARVVRVCRSVHGPVQQRAGDVAYARRYAVWGRELETLPALAELERARDVDDVDRLAARLTWTENLLAADAHGGLGFWHPGLHPLRPRRWDERLPLPGDGRAEWRGFLAPDRRPHVVRPRRGWLVNWNNTPSVGWTNGDGQARALVKGPYHRAALLARLVERLSSEEPTFAGAEAVVRDAGTLAQQRPLATERLRAALAAGPPPEGGALLEALLAWDGSYARTAPDGTVDPGVAAWDELKLQAARRALAPLGPGAQTLDDELRFPGSLHRFDVTVGEAYALRTLPPQELAAAAQDAAAALAGRFGTAQPAGWRAPRETYPVRGAGAGPSLTLPFFDRGTFEQVVAWGR
jgi:hypothetical protein